MTSLEQTRTIHGLRRSLKLSDDEYRGLLEDRTGKRSSTQLNVVEADGVIDTLRTLAGSPKTRPASSLSGPYASKLLALWLSAWNLGIVRQPNDRALIAFVERQTGLSHTRFLREPADAAKAIEALKSWIAREGGVVWPGTTGAADPVRLSKQAVVDAIARKLGVDWVTEGRLLGLPQSLGAYGHSHFDRLAAALGARLRAGQKRGAAA